MIDGDTKLIVHIGYPTATFRAPMIYNPCFTRHGINAAVMPLGVTSENFRQAFPQICRFTNFHGALITIPHKVAVVSGMAIAQNIGTMLTALLPALFASVAPPGSTSVPATIGALAFGVAVISALAAWSARETYRVHLNDLGDPAARAVDKAEYDRLRQQNVAAAI